MDKTKFVLILGISAVLGLATVSLATISLVHLNLWVSTLSSMQVRFSLPFFTAMSGVFVVIGAYARKSRKKIRFEKLIFSP